MNATEVHPRGVEVWGGQDIINHPLLYYQTLQSNPNLKILHHIHLITPTIQLLSSIIYQV